MPGDWQVRFGGGAGETRREQSRQGAPALSDSVPVRARSWPATPASTRRPGSSSPDADGGPRRLVMSTDFYTVYESAGKKAAAWSTCTALLTSEAFRPGRGREPRSAGALDGGVAGPVRDLYRAHDELMAAWQENAAPAPRAEEAAAARLEKAHAGWDEAITGIDTARKKQAQAPGLQEPAKKALATLNREWDGLIAHRDYPMISLDNYPDVAVMPKSGLGGGFPLAGAVAWPRSSAGSQGLKFPSFIGP